jgi:HEPN domain-containing protein
VAVTRTELQRLAIERINDAKVLLGARRWSAAYYLAGYAVEAGLKACIAKLKKSDEFPDKNFAEKCWTHNLTQLLVLAGLNSAFDVDKAANAVLAENWETVKDWKEASRYVLIGKEDAEDLYEAIADRKNGVLSWLKARW